MTTDDPAYAPTVKNQGEGGRSVLTERDLLFGRMAVVNGIVDQKTIDDAHLAVRHSSKSLGELLVETAAISDEDRKDIERLVERHIAKHDDDPQKSLAVFLATVLHFSPLADKSATANHHRSNGVTPAKTIADYEILEEIARGGMGVVFKARQKRLNRLVAVKMIRTGEFADDEQVQRFHSEAEAAAKLDHPGIVPVYEVGEANGQHFFSMALVEGQSLHARVKDEGPLNPEQAAALVKTVAEAMQFAHDKGIVHRDIKPQNILLDSHGQPRITDFGLAKQLHGGSDLTATGQIMGTPSYMAPEQAAGVVGGIGTASDVYALGATLYFLLTGRPPFQAASPMETIRQVADDEPVPPRRLNSAIPRDLETICLKCLEKDPTLRYCSAQELANEVERYLRREPIHARPVTRTERAWRWCRRNPVIAISIATVLLIGIGAGGVVFAQRRVNQEAMVASQQASERREVETAVTAMTGARGILVPYLIGDLEKFPREMVLKELRHQFQSADEVEALPLAYALAHFGDARVKFLVSQVEVAAPDEVTNLVAALGRSGGETDAALKTAAQVAHNSRNWRLNARLAMLGLHLNDPSIAEKMSQLRSDPTQRTLFIDECSSWHGDLQRLAYLAAKCDDIPLRTAVACAVGSVPRDTVPQPARQAWKEVLSTWYEVQPDTLTHSTAGWVLRAWEMKLPDIPTAQTPVQTRDWHVNSVGMTLLKIPSGSFVRKVSSKDHVIDQTVTLSRSFLLADREVSREQFQRFIDDSYYPKAEKPDDWSGAHEFYSPTELHPVQQVSWHDAILFCNWLSGKEELQLCYKRTGRKKKSLLNSVEYDEWRLIPDTNGYRLPTQAEWGYACRAGTVTVFSHGDDESLLDRYAITRAGHTEIPGSRLPNGFGLFDMHGNVSEWCQDWLGPYRQWLGDESHVVDPTGPADGELRVRRGGSYRLPAVDARTNSFSNHHPNDRIDYSLGFRVARTNP